MTRDRFLVDSAAYNLALGGLIVGSLYYNAEMWINDYPHNIREKFGPRSKEASRLANLVAIPFFLIALGGVIWSNLRLKKAQGGKLTRSAAFVNAYALFFSFWLFDLTVLDWLLFVTLTPDFIVLPGTEGMAGYDDYAFHFKVAFPVLLLLVIPCLVVALLTAGGSNSE